jgi:hypothetical protein
MLGITTENPRQADVEKVSELVIEIIGSSLFPARRDGASRTPRRDHRRRETCGQTNRRRENRRPRDGIFSACEDPRRVASRMHDHRLEVRVDGVRR